MIAPRTLGVAAKENDLALVVALLDEGADIEARDARGYSALMLAVYAGNVEVSELLLARGADPNTADLAGNSVLMGAAFNGHLHLVEKLAARGADLRTKNAAGLDARAFASTFGRTEVVALFDKMEKEQSS
jgi:ankyrin repeat protein